jgi:hypothetical protein
MERAEAQVAAPEKSGAASSGVRLYDIRDYGAKGGGTVLVPAGIYVIGTVELKSNVTLHITAAGKLLGSDEGKQYHSVDAIPLRGDTTLEDGNWALLFAVNAYNIVIEGPGTIDGQGAQFHSAVRGTPPPSGLGGLKRPYHFLAYRCENLRVRNLSLVDCAYHNIRIIQSRRIFLDSLFLHNRVNGNNDGFHLISTEFVTISNCIVQCGDDACAMFGSCKNIVVTNSYFSTRWSVFRFGGGACGEHHGLQLHALRSVRLPNQVSGRSGIEIREHLRLKPGAQRRNWPDQHQHRRPSSTVVLGGGGTRDEATREVPKTFGEYFALGPIPAYGLYARNCRGLTLQNVRLEVSAAEMRPAVILERVEDVAVNGFGVQGNPEAESILRLTDTKHVYFAAVRVLTPSSTFLRVEGAECENIALDGGDWLRAAKAVDYAEGAQEKAVRLRSIV